MEIMGISGVAAITVICLLVGWIVKQQTPLKDELIPAIVGVVGGILGVVGWKVMDGFPANDVLTAIAVGIVSGLASTGANQIVKQLGKIGGGGDG